MTEVLIVSKTRMSNNGACIGGITLPDYRSVRLLNEVGRYHPANTDMNTGQLYEMTLTPAKFTVAPHKENVLILNKRLIQDGINVEQYICRKLGKHFLGWGA